MMDTGNYDRRGTPQSSQIVWMEQRIQELETDNEQLRVVLRRLREHFQALNQSRGYASEIIREALKGEKDGQEVVEPVPDAN